MRQHHFETQALATLAVQERETSRYLLFDEQHQLCGRRAGGDQMPELVRPSQSVQALAFSGIHLISPRLLPMIAEQRCIFDHSIVICASRRREKKFSSFRADQYYWRDLGRPENVAQAAQDLENRVISP